MFLPTMIICLNMLSEEHTFLVLGSHPARVRDTILVVLSDLPSHIVLSHSLNVLLVKQLTEEVRLRILHALQLPTEPFVFFQLKVTNDLAELYLLEELLALIFVSFALFHNFLELAAQLNGHWVALSCLVTSLGGLTRFYLVLAVNRQSWLFLLGNMSGLVPLRPLRPVARRWQLGIWESFSTRQFGH